MTSTTAWRRALDLGRAQHGILAVRQAVALGVPRTTFDDRVRREGWERPYRGLVLLPGCDRDARTTIRAAGLAVGSAAVITGTSALYLQGAVDHAPVRVHVAVPHGCTAPRWDGVRVVRSRTLRHAHLVPDAGVWVATPARAIVDAAATHGRARLRTWLIDARQRRLTTVGEVAALTRSIPSAHGRGRLLAACRDVDDSAADSAPVAEVERRLRAEGFDLDVPPRTVAVPGRVLHPDLTVRGIPVAIEVDGYGAHHDRRSLDLDQRKHNAYSLAGWVVLRIGWTRLARDWEGFVVELRTAIHGRGGSVPSQGPSIGDRVGGAT